MLYMEIIAVCSQIHTKHINTLCGQNVELLNVKLGSKQPLVPYNLLIYSSNSCRKFIICALHLLLNFIRLNLLSRSD